jgi:hypothetical protein
MSTRIRGENRHKPDLSLEARTDHRSAAMSDNVPAEIRAWIECAECGRTEKPTIPVRIPPAIASLTLEKVCVPCERCGAYAMMYLQRTATRMP